MITAPPTSVGAEGLSSKNIHTQTGPSTTSRSVMSDLGRGKIASGEKRQAETHLERADEEEDSELVAIDLSRVHEPERLRGRP
jgi:hypothetical protein